MQSETRFCVHYKLPRGGGTRALQLSADSAGLMHRWLELIGRHLHERSDGLCKRARACQRSPRGERTGLPGWALGHAWEGGSARVPQ